MKTATVRQLHTKFPCIESRLAKRKSVQITRHKVNVAELIAPHTTKPDFTKRFARKAKRNQTRKSAVALLLEERGALSLLTKIKRFSSARFD